jgi:DNA-binding NarL/FixJ family response regulator
VPTSPSGNDSPSARPEPVVSRLDRLEQRLARLEGRSSRGDNEAGRLTAHQRAIAELVANGHTNRETGEHLGISAKTVEWNLSRIYRRLGLRSRTELAACLLRPRLDSARRLDGTGRNQKGEDR